MRGSAVWAILAAGSLAAFACSDNGSSPGGPALGDGGAAAGGGLSAGGAATGGRESVDPEPSPTQPVDRFALPPLLSETGLYEADMSTLGADVRPYRPQFPLWTDGAAKRRWARLPPGATIDVSDVDFWDYPEGTTFWKEFERDDVRVETRILQKQSGGSWRMGAYQWREDLSDADLVLAGVEDASGTPHDVPSEEQCWSCHNQMPDRVLGFTAVQLSHDGESTLGYGGASSSAEPSEQEWTLSGLNEGKVLSAEVASLDVPGDARERAVLGYLHANCGSCHNENGSAYGRSSLGLWLLAGELGSVEQTETHRSTVGVEASLPFDGPEGAPLRIDPQSPSTSALFRRFDEVEADYAMPTLGREVVDPTGRALLLEWINGLPTQM